MRRLVFCALLIVLCTTLALAADEALTVTQDENSMERIISRYLQDSYKVSVEEKKLADGDLALLVLMDGKGGPDFNVVVDTQACAKDDAGKVTERAVTVQVFTGGKVPEGKRAAVFEALNKFLAGMWFASIYIDDDGEIACQWCVNVMKEGLPTEYVADAVIRVADSWRKFRPQAEAALGEG